MTSCHNHEANQIDDIVERVFDKQELKCFAEVLGSVVPLRQLQVRGYEENQLRLTGIVEGEEFANGFRHIYTRTLLYFASKMLTRSDETWVEEVARASEEVVKRALSEQIFPLSWAQLVKLEECERDSAPPIALQHFQQDDSADNQEAQEKAGFNVVNPLLIAEGKNNNDRDNFLKGPTMPNNSTQFAVALANKKQPALIVSDTNHFGDLELDSQSNSKAGGTAAAVIAPQPVRGKRLGGNAAPTFPQKAERNVQPPADDFEGLLEDLDSGGAGAGATIVQQQPINNNNEFAQKLQKEPVGNNKKSLKEVFGLQQPKINNLGSAAAHPGSALRLESPREEQSSVLQQSHEANNSRLVAAAPVVPTEQVFQRDTVFSAQNQQEDQEESKQQIRNGSRVARAANLNNNSSGLQQQKQAGSQYTQYELGVEQIGTNFNEVQHLVSAENGKSTAAAQLNRSNLVSEDSVLRNSSLLWQAQKVVQPNQGTTSAVAPAETTNATQQLQIAPKKKHIEDEILDMLEDIENLPPPPPPKRSQQTSSFPEDSEDLLDNSAHNAGTKNAAQIGGGGNNSYATKYLKNVKQIVAFLQGLSVNDVQFNARQLDREALQSSFRACENLRKSRVLRSCKQRLNKCFELQLRAIRTAIKVSLDLYAINGTLEPKELADAEILETIEENNKNAYIGIGSEKAWADAVAHETENLWSLHYNAHDQTLAVFRSVYKDIKCTLFELNEDVVYGIWANLVFELYYVTNDDDERYSIQTHKNFLRNIIIESAENPLGYAPFYSGGVAVHF